MKKIILVVLMLISISCTNKTPQSEKDFISYMTILQKKGEYLQFSGFEGNDEKLIKYAPYFVENAKKVEFKILKTEQKNNQSVITVFIKSPDLDYYDNQYPKYNREENFDNYAPQKAVFMGDALKQKDLKFKENTIFVYMIYKDNRWILDSGIKNNDFFYMINHKIF
ncbi:hypothetical protein [Sebaldella sp. S0638]|uniref:hypothetical protein n=1 Tax=Sebaldella sp. S0638 TaxID=2957809 RepID=UPI0020A1F556|nr:hypothetical protein [Sebaldella sp. S0638]MCP1225309.1 hypothetical protein [Sebaldella sp. S0638]